MLLINNPLFPTEFKSIFLYFLFKIIIMIFFFRFICPKKIHTSNDP